MTAKEVGVGNLKVTVTGVGSATIPIEVYKLPIFNGYAEKNEYVYTGSPITPQVIHVDSYDYIQLVEGEDFAVSYKNNIKCGKSFFIISPLKDTISGNTDSYFIIIPAKSKITKMTPGKGSLKVKLRNQKISGVTGYQISYCVNGSDAWQDVFTKKPARTIKKLKKGKTYQIKARAYVKISKVKYYGEWSEVGLSKKIK